jgi:hypothetical protein
MTNPLPPLAGGCLCGAVRYEAAQGPGALAIAAWHADDGLKASRLDTNAPINLRWRTAYGDAVQPGLDAVRDGTMSASPPEPSP